MITMKASITDKRAFRLKNIIVKSRSRLMRDHPFFALMLMHTGFIAVSDSDTISTNGKYIFFNPDYLDKLKPEEVDFVLCHQLVHTINGDIRRPKDYAGDSFHHACDIVANATLEKEGFQADKYPHLGKIFKEGFSSIPAWKQSPYDVYNSLPYLVSSFDEKTRKRFMFDSDKYWGFVPPPSSSCTRIIDPKAPNGSVNEKGSFPVLNQADKAAAFQAGSSEESQKDQLLNVAAAAECLAKGDTSSGRNLLPRFAERALLSMPKPVMDWREILDAFVQEEITDYTFLPPDRRFDESDFFLPDYNEKDVSIRDILFMVDTSGSISEAALTEVYSEICSAIEQFNGKLVGYLGFFDVDVVTPEPFDSIDDIHRIKPFGGGGTSFDIIFNYIRNEAEIRPCALIIMTDGYAPFPDQSVTDGIPVLWLLNNTEITPPWGKVARRLQRKICY